MSQSPTDLLFEKALAWRQRGSFGLAEAAFRQVLQHDPHHPEALEHLALLLQESGRREEAEDLYRRLLSHSPQRVEALNNLANLVRDSGRLDESLRLLEMALTLRPELAPLHNNLGIGHYLMGRREQALRCFEEALQRQSAYPEAWRNRGQVLLELGRLDEALAAFEAALAVHGAFAEAHLGRGEALWGLKRWEEGIQSMQRAVALHPSWGLAWDRLGQTLGEAGRLDESLLAHKRAVSLEPGNGSFRNNLGRSLLEARRIEEAMEAFGAAETLGADLATCVANRGSALLLLNRPEEALQAFEQALTLGTGEVSLWNNPGTALQAMGRVEEALSAFDRALDRHRSPETLFNRSLLLLLSGRYREAWPGFELRHETHRMRRFRRDFSCPLWQGEPPAGRRLLLHAEQGLGDTLQMLRFLPRLLETGAQLVLEVQPPLKPLLLHLSDRLTLLQKGDPLPECDLHLPLMSLLSVLQVDLDTIPGREGYLPLSGEAAISGVRPVVGLVWQGNPDHLNDHNRSIPLPLMRELLSLEGVRFLLLAHGAAAREPELHAMAGERVESRDMAETARILQGLDLVITVDTAIAHLAGAMGRPAWVLLPWMPDWRWGRVGEVSPWYASLRLWRQRGPGDWPEVLARVRAALPGYLHGQNGIRDTHDANPFRGDALMGPAGG
ncbi:MAG: tetratricopeptide repeat protein [Magnetococcales bacterium]|nr:tetratricopeptide repeat protein [Magnetococcales bacterium]